MPKISECDCCILYAHKPHLVCGVHPNGVDTDTCIDFRANPNFQEEEQWCVEDKIHIEFFHTIDFLRNW